MKRYISDSTLFVFVFFLAACKPEKNINPDEVRLIAIDVPQNSVDIVHMHFDYNGAGQITRVRSTGNNDTVTIFDVRYSGNEIILARPEQNTAGLSISDTIRLTIDNNNLVQKRIESSFAEFKAPANSPQRTFTYDTVVYEYDAGLLKKSTRGFSDSTWFLDNFGRVQISLERRTGVDTYTNSNGNLIAINGSSDFTAVSRQSGNTYTTKRNAVSATTFQYTKRYGNKTDFSNAAVLNELGLFPDLRINRNYANMPDRITHTGTEKDNSGVVTSTDNSDQSYILGYNSYGFLKTSIGATSPSLKTSFIYNK